MKIFKTNPNFQRVGLNTNELLSLLIDNSKKFIDLPVYHLGNSKELRISNHPGILVQRFLPTVYSYRFNRAGVVAGTDIVRMNISSLFWQHLHDAGIKTCVLAVNENFALVTQERVPPVEIIVKAALIGTPTHIYYDLIGSTDRFGHVFVKNKLHKPYVRFDYRNPLMDKNGNRLKDEQLPLLLANRLIDIEMAEYTALQIFDVIQSICHRAKFEILDCCLFLNEAGNVLCGEISPDNMRIKSLSIGDDYDKDIWRKDGSPEMLLNRWLEFQHQLEIAHETN